jgi:endonuclease/exonuclease/phosphatase family metal-dependent hydrolase
MARTFDLHLELPSTTFRSLLHQWQLGLVAATLVFAFIPIDASQIQADDARNADQIVLRVISYNVQFLPDPVSWRNERPNPEYRAKRIADELRNFDLAGLQEVFHVSHRGQLIAHTRANWNGELHDLASPQPEGFFTSGGCLLLSRRPLIASSTVVFKNFSKPADYGQRADGFAAKGVLHARIARSAQEPKNFIDVFVTHLEARADDLRPLQYKELAEFIKKTSDENHPMLLLGDLNTYGMPKQQNDPTSQYAALMRELNAARPNGGVIDLWPKLKGDALGGTTEQESAEIGKRIDYIMVGNPKSAKMRLTPKRIAVELFQDEQVGALSDHNAVVADFDWPSHTQNE